MTVIPQERAQRASVGIWLHVFGGGHLAMTVDPDTSYRSCGMTIRGFGNAR